jgi:hypothetical protein
MTVTLYLIALTLCLANSLFMLCTQPEMPTWGKIVNSLIIVAGFVPGLNIAVAACLLVFGLTALVTEELSQ